MGGDRPGGQTEAQYEAAMGQPRKRTDGEAQVLDITKVVAEQKARDMEAAEEEARQRGCMKERRRQERRRKQLVKDRLEILAARKRDKENKFAWNRVHDGAQMVYYGAGFVTVQQAMEQVESKAQEQERRRQQVDVLDPSWGLDYYVNENNMVVKKNSKAEMDEAKEENGERLIK